VSSGNLGALNASLIGENVGMGGSVDEIQVAFMNSAHHRENILDAGFNQVGIGVIVSGGTVFVTEDFLQAKGGPVSARPTPVAHPVVKKPASAPKPVNRVASAPKRAAAAPAASPPTSAAPAPAPTGVVTAVPYEPAPAAAAAPGRVLNQAVSGHGTSAWWAGLLGIMLLAGGAGGHLVVRRRRGA
jgi:hypothetical protein